MEPGVGSLNKESGFLIFSGFLAKPGSETVIWKSCVDRSSVHAGCDFNCGFVSVGQLTVLGTYDVTSTIGVRLETGYRLLSSSQMKADQNYAQVVKEGELLRDDQNTNIKGDGSGVYMGLSVNIKL